VSDTASKDSDGEIIKEARINHEKGNIVKFLKSWDAGSLVAVESIGSWYWIVDEVEQAKMHPRLVHARKAKLMLGMIDKTDKLDARGLNRLQQTGTLPTVWIPPMDIRDKRELPRTRMVFAHQRTKLKNRIHSVLAKYGLQYQFEDISDIFGKKGREKINKCSKELPEHTCYTLVILLHQLDATSESLASYSGTVPSVHASGGKVRYGRLRPDTNHYLKWAFSEAGNSVAVNHKRWPDRHVSKLYKRVRTRRGHPEAVGAVARHLAEATYWILSKKEPYLERGLSKVKSAKV